MCVFKISDVFTNTIYCISYDEKMMNIFLTAAHQYKDSYVLGKKQYDLILFCIPEIQLFDYKVTFVNSQP